MSSVCVDLDRAKLKLNFYNNFHVCFAGLDLTKSKIHSFEERRLTSLITMYAIEKKFEIEMKLRKVCLHHHFVLPTLFKH